MSGAAVMLFGAKLWMKRKTCPKTKKYENATPRKNSSVLEITSGRLVQLGENQGRQRR